jgi:CsoR family transcriptional regulator, copper-sensing transcriptional repressor
MINEQQQKDALLRLKRIQGQIRGLEKMIEEKRYCIDILDQVASVKSALDGVGLLLMRTHIDSCVTSSIKAGKSGKVIDELMETLDRFVR